LRECAKPIDRVHLAADVGTYTGATLAKASSRRFLRTGATADLDREITLFEQALRAAPADHPDRPLILSILGSALRIRFEHTGNTADLDRAITFGEQAGTAAAPDDPARSRYLWYLSNLGAALRTRFERSGNTADLDRAITVGEQAVAATALDDPARSRYVPVQPRRRARHPV